MIDPISTPQMAQLSDEYFPEVSLSDFNSDSSLFVSDSNVDNPIDKSVNIDEILFIEEDLSLDEDNVTVTDPSAADGEIGSFKQGNIGDCWALSSLIAFDSTEKGHQLLNDHVQQAEDGTYYINFDGVNNPDGTKYVASVTQDELEQAKASGMYSTGDDDVLMWELAIEELRGSICSMSNPYEGVTLSFMSNGIMIGEDGKLNGGSLNDFIYYLTGKAGNIDTYYIRDKNYIPMYYDDTFDYSCAELLTPQGVHDNAITVSFASDREGGQPVYDINGNQVYTVPTGYFDNGCPRGHETAVKDVYTDLNTGKDVVVIVNPQDSTQELHIYKDELCDHIADISWYNYNEASFTSFES